MKKLYQSELYTKHHWKNVGTILFVLILVGGKFKGNIFLPRFAYHTSGNFVSGTDCSDRNV